MTDKVDKYQKLMVMMDDAALAGDDELEDELGTQLDKLWQSMTSAEIELTQGKTMRSIKL